jgi:hypothetical protein
MLLVVVDRSSGAPSRRPVTRPRRKVARWGAVKTKILVTLAVGALVLGACGGGASATAGAAGTTRSDATSGPAETAATEVTGAPDTGDTFDACALLTTDEVKGVTGADTKAEVDPTSSRADWVAGQCWWNSEDLTTRFSLDVGTPASIAKSSSPTTKEQMEISRLVYKSFDDYAEIPGLGEDAFYGAGMLFAIKNGSMLQVAGLNLDKAKATELAKLALARM